MESVENDQQLTNRFQAAADILKLRLPTLAKILRISQDAAFSLIHGQSVPSEEQITLLERKARDKQQVLQELDDELSRLKALAREYMQRMKGD